MRNAVEIEKLRGEFGDTDARREADMKELKARVRRLEARRRLRIDDG